MPSVRVARSSAPQRFRERPSKKKQVKEKRNRNLDAFAIAQEENPEKLKYRKHRYGEAESEGQDQSRKRRRDSDEDGEDDEDPDSEDDDKPKGKAKRPRVFDGLDADGGSDSSGNEWHDGVNSSDESEEIDSDEAFGESDEERFADWTFRDSKSKKNSSKKQPTRSDTAGDLEEQDDEDGDSDGSLGSDAIDLATMLDNPVESSDDEPDTTAPPSKASKKSRTSSRNETSLDSAQSSDEDGSRADQDSMSSFSDEDADDEDMNDDDDEQDQAKLTKLRSMVGAMEKREQAPSDDEDESANLKPGALLAAMQQIASGNKKPSRRDRQQKARDAPLTAPLPKRQQDKLDRTAAYAEATKEFDKWQPTVKQNREAEHLVFPRPDPTAQAPLGANRMLPTAPSKPQSELEATMQSILQQSGLASSTTKEPSRDDEGDELPENTPSLKEVQSRRAELRRARELLFREEQRAKRIKKIKSKAYRRVHRKEKERNALSERELLNDAADNAENAKERHDRRRAEERMGTRHKESKWSRTAKKSGQLAWNESARAGVEDMARRDEQLRRRIQGQPASSGSEGSGSDYEDGDAESDDDDAFRLRANEQLDALAEPEPAEDTGRAGRLANLAFMQRADAARRQTNDEAVAALRRDLAGGAGSGSGSDGEFEDEEEIPLGRRVFGAPSEASTAPKKPARKPRVNEFEEGDVSSDEDGDSGKVPPVAEPAPPSTHPLQNHTKTKPPAKPPVSNPKAESKLPSKPTQSALIASAFKSTESTSPKRKPKAKKLTTLPDAPSDNDSDSSNASEPEPVLSNASLIASAFGTDDTSSASFRAEKRALAHAEAPNASTSTTNDLPGWGAWAGAGTKPPRSKPTRDMQRKAAAKAATAASIASRSDAGKRDVILSQRRNKKSAKLLAGALPFPYESAAQYERGLRVPIGKEWNAKSVVGENVKPRVLVRGGVVKPMERME